MVGNNTRFFGYILRLIEAKVADIQHGEIEIHFTIHGNQIVRHSIGERHIHLGPHHDEMNFNLTNGEGRSAI